MMGYMLVWVVAVAVTGAVGLTAMCEEITDPGAWMLWGVFIGGVGVAGGLFILEVTK